MWSRQGQLAWGVSHRVWLIVGEYQSTMRPGHGPMRLPATVWEVCTAATKGNVCMCTCSCTYAYVDCQGCGRWQHSMHPSMPSCRGC